MKDTKPFYKFFVIAFGLKMSGNILTAILYGLYYGYGDTFTYFGLVIDLHNQFLQAPLDFFSLFNSIPSPRGTQHVYNVGFVFSLITFNSYLAVSFLFTFLSVIGGWLVYLVLIDLYPKVKKQLAFCTLFIPSIWFWGNGLQKESLMVFGIGIILYSFYQIFFKRNYYPIIFLPIGYYSIMVKSYSFYLLMLMIVLWILFQYSSKIRVAAVRLIFILTFSIIAIGGIGAYFYTSGAGLEIILSESNVVNDAVSTAGYISRITSEKGGSGYDLGVPENSIESLISKLFPAINVTLFRPYLWEIGKVVNLPSAIESFVLLIMVLYVLFKTRIFGFFRIVISSPFLLSCFVFTLLFSFIVGFTSYNFGTLARYKLPVAMFFYALVYLVYHEYKERKISLD